MNDKAVCRRAPATQGLLKRVFPNKKPHNKKLQYTIINVSVNITQHWKFPNDAASDQAGKDLQCETYM